MSELQGLKKAELSEIAHRLAIHTLTKDTKKVLIEKLTEFIAQNPEKNVALVQAALDAEIGHEEKLHELSTKTSQVSATTDDEEEEEEDDDVEDEEEEEEAEDDEEDKDYTEGPPIDLYTYVVDPALEFFEKSYSNVLEFTDSIGVTTVDINGELRETLSKLVTLNYIEGLLEFVFFLYNFVPFVAVKDNSSIHPLLKDNIPQLNSCNIEIPDLIAALDLTTLQTAIAWILFSVAAPLVVSYYVNFTRRLITFDDDTEIFARIYKYDPFIFAVTKVVILLFLGVPAHHEFAFASTWISYVHHHTYAILDHYQKLIVLLGNFPYVLGFANAAVALYSQFEEY